MTIKPFILSNIKQGATWVCLGPDRLAEANFGHLPDNPMNDPDFCDEQMRKWTAREGADYSWTPAFELRTNLWRNHYFADDNLLHRMRHWGIDLNVPAGSVAHAPADCEVVRVIRDTSRGGWGGAVFCRRTDAGCNGARYFIYAHLQHDLPDEYDTFKAGDVLGVVGDKRVNGGWYPHLHVQCFDQNMFDKFWPELEKMDGYGPNDMPTFPGIYDPMRLIMR